jgi:hypothetical protein
MTWPVRIALAVLAWGVPFLLIVCIVRVGMFLTR